MAVTGLVLAGTLVAACANSTASTPTSTSTTLPPTSAASTTGAPTTTPATTTPATTTTAADNGHVRVLGLWSGPELDSFMTVKSLWEHDSGGTVEWIGTRDLPKELGAQIDAGTPPDIAVLPSIGLLHELAAKGELVALATFMDMSQVQQDYSPAWIDLGTDGGKLYGLFSKVTDKSTVWYSPAAFTAANYTVPTTWDEMVHLADTMVTDGRTPFSVVAPKVPGGGGWALTDWISNIVLDMCGAERYDQWVAGQVPWTDACIGRAFEMFTALVSKPGYVRGGSAGILATSDADGSYPMYTDPPSAYMYPLSSFAQAFIASRFPKLVPGEGYGFFPFPTIDAANAGSVTIGADVVVMLHDTPAARSFMTFLAGTASQRKWIELGGFTSVNRSVPMDAYPDPVARAAAQALLDAKVVRFGAGDSMPASVQQAWWKAMVQLVQDPTKLDSILTSMTAVAKQAAAG